MEPNDTSPPGPPGSLAGTAALPCDLRLAGHRAAVGSVAMDPSGGVLASADVAGEVRIWNLRTGRGAVAHRSPRGPASVAFGGRSELLLVSDPLGITVLEVGGAVARMARPGRAPDTAWLYGAAALPPRTFPAGGSAAISPCGDRLAVGGSDGTLRVVDRETGARLSALPGHRGGVLCLRFSPDGASLASGGLDRRLRLWDPLEGTQTASLEVGEPVRCLAWHPSARALACSAPGCCAGLWHPESGLRLHLFEGHPEPVLDLAFDPAGALLASTSGRGSLALRLWDVATGGVIDPVVVGAAFSVAFAPDARLAVGCRDGTIAVLSLAPPG